MTGLPCAHPGCKATAALGSEGRWWCFEHLPETQIDPDAVLKPGMYGYERCAACGCGIHPRDEKRSPEVRWCQDCWWQEQTAAFLATGDAHPNALPRLERMKAKGKL